MTPTLLVLAAGMGSRYGGLKQLDPVGPSGETLLDYSVFDALRAGFGRVVFVIRRDFERDFREGIGRRYEGQVQVDYVFQEMTDIPAGGEVSPTRKKPLGTGHAIWCAREAIQGPFAAINADDFYGRDAYRAAGQFLTEMGGDEAKFAMVGYRLDRTLSEHGTVARGVCAVDSEGDLLRIVEHTAIAKTPEGPRETQTDGSALAFTGAESVSMNFWSFTPAVFQFLGEGLARFLKTALHDDKAEYYIPSAVAEMIGAGKATVRVLETQSPWFGVTYREDKPVVMESIARLVESGEYPRALTQAAV